MIFAPYKVDVSMYSGGIWTGPMREICLVDALENLHFGTGSVLSVF